MQQPLITLYVMKIYSPASYQINYVTVDQPVMNDQALLLCKLGGPNGTHCQVHNIVLEIELSGR